MYAISTAGLVSILALASSLAVVVQAKPVPVCTSTVVSLATSCRSQASTFNHDVAEFTAWLFAYNDNVNVGCTNLTIGETVRVFLL